MFQDSDSWVKGIWESLHMVDLLKVESVCVKPEILKDIKRRDMKSPCLFKNTTHNYNIKLCVDSLIILFLFSQYVSSAFILYKESCWNFPSSPVAKTLHFQMQGAWVQFLVRELRSCMRCGRGSKGKEQHLFLCSVRSQTFCEGSCGLSFNFCQVESEEQVLS